MSFNNTYLNTPPWLDKGDNAWQLTAATLVGLQSIPGLVILYGGIVKRKWAINSAFMAFYAFAMVLMCWVMWAYKMAFGVPWGKAVFVGEPGPVLIMDRLLSQAILPTSGLAANFPLSTMVYFQFVFAAITLVITAGAFLGRMNFLAWMVYVPLWLTFSYTVGAYSLWGGGFLAVRGVIDYSGGYVIHLSSGTAGFVGAYWIGPRLAADREDFKPHNVLLTMVGAGILWLGWNGFNGGDPYNAGTDAGVAVLNTNITTAASLLTWTFLDMLYYKKPSIIGSVQGMITGLVAITPCAGVIDGWAAILLGALSGSIPWVTMNIAGKKLKLFVVHVDDTLGVFHTHTVAGLVGGLFVGVFACIRGSVAFGLTTTGAIDGNWKQIYIQLYGALFIIALNIVMTSIIMNFIKHVLRIPLRMKEEYLLIGDEAIHGENAYSMHDERLLYDSHPRRQSHDVEQGRAGTVLHRGGSGDIDSNEDKAPK